MDPKSRLANFIRWVMRDTIYHGTYECTVERQHDDDSLDLLPDDERVRGTGLSRVELWHGLPGVRVKVVVGSRVLLAFRNGDPTKPYASLWQRGSIEEISFDGGQSPIARQGDAVAVYWPPSLTIVGAIPAGALTGTVTIGTQSAGVIQTGATKVLA
jgi:hypothetical protein